MSADALGGKPLTLPQLLRLIESDINGWKKQKKAGQKYTLPVIYDDGEIKEPQPLDELIAHWEKEKTHLEEVIAWAETRKPGSSRKENGEQLMKEYEQMLKNG